MISDTRLVVDHDHCEYCGAPIDGVCGTSRLMSPCSTFRNGLCAGGWTTLQTRSRKKRKTPAGSLSVSTIFEEILATQRRGSDANRLVIWDWGGWNDLERFLDHYRGTATLEAQR